MGTVLLYSGGVDSWLIGKIAKPDIKLFFDLGTASSDAEYQRILQNGDTDVIVDHTLRGLGELERQDNFILPFRNGFMIERAAEYGEHIILGANKTDRHNDKTLEFAEKIQDLLNYYYGPCEDGRCVDKDIYVDLSYKKYDRTDLCKLYLESGGSIEEAIYHSFSCYTPVNNNGKLEECFNCRHCCIKMMGFLTAGAKFPKGYMRKFKDFLESTINHYNNTGIWEDRLYDINWYKLAYKLAVEDSLAE